MKPPTFETILKEANKSALFLHNRNLTMDEIEGISCAITSTGRHQGRLKLKSPSKWDNMMGFAAWQGMQPNPHKISIGGLFFVTGPAKELLDILMTIKWPASMDRDMDALVSMGAW